MTVKKVAFAGLLAVGLVFASFSKERKTPAPPAPYAVPEQMFDIWQEMGSEKAKGLKTTVTEFSLSPQVTFGEYKVYLAAMKKDSSFAFYKSQLPDSTMCLPETYAQYMSGNAYDPYPVVGISWDNAMNYFRWKTIRENKDGIYDTIYRLPLISEWMSAYRFFQTVPSLKNELNHDYSDWTLVSKDETIYDMNIMDYHSYPYFATPDDPKVMKRKLAIGNSFHFSQQRLVDFYNWTYYEFEGYSHISFRYVKKKVDPLPENRKPFMPQIYADHSTLQYWGLEQKPAKKKKK